MSKHMSTPPQWALRLIDDWVNFGDEPEVRLGAAIKYIGIGQFGGRAHPVTSVYPKGTKYVVVIIDCAAVHRVRGKGRDYGYHVWMRSKNESAGASGHYDTLDEALEAYDWHLDRTPQQTALF